MNSPSDKAKSLNGTSGADETLRIIARLPAPGGIEGRVMEALENAPRGTRVLPWPSQSGLHRGSMQRSLMRGVAAAAIVLVVGGGSWGVYSHVRPQAPKLVAMPRVAAPGGFSTGGAMRTPQTLDGPVLTHPVTPASHQATARPSLPTPSAKKAQKAAKAVSTTK
jgi:hypothetical protein